ncbi:MAG TPA: PEPxxWA-CTERM sorting domain-containing protein [Caulobacteraceae bacterium]
MSSFLALDLAPGNYFIQIKPSYITANNEVDSGTVITAVPEPAGWALMIVGVAAIGGALRARPASGVDRGVAASTLSSPKRDARRGRGGRVQAACRSAAPPAVCFEGH